MGNHLRFAAAFFMIIFFRLEAIDPHLDISQYCIDEFTAASGFPNNMVLDIVQSREGFIWVATWNGIVVFDGDRFRVFSSRTHVSFKSNMLMALCRDRDDGFWIATWGGGLLHFSRGKFHRYSKSDGLADDKVRSLLLDDKGTLWVGTDNGLSTFQNGTWRSFGKSEGLPSVQVKSLMQDRHGNVWVGTSGMVSRLTHGRFLSYSVGREREQNMVYALMEDQDGNVWAGTSEGIFVWRTDRFVSPPWSTKLPPASVRRLLQDREKTIWIGTEKGLFRLRHGGNLEPVETDRVKTQPITALFQDSQGNLWVGTASGTIEDGLFRFRDGRFVNYGVLQGMRNAKVNSILELGPDRYLVGTDQGLYQLQKGKVALFSKEKKLNASIVVALLQDVRDNLWVGLNPGLIVLAGGKWTDIVKLKGRIVQALIRDRKGNVWIGTDRGLFIAPAGEWWRLIDLNEFAEEYVNSFALSQGERIWMCTAGSGALLLEKGKVIRRLDMTAGLKTNNTIWLSEDPDGKLWIATVKGLHWVRKERISSFSLSDGFLAEEIFYFLEDGSGKFWIGCNNGIFTVSKRELQESASLGKRRLHCVQYIERDGLKSRICIGGAQNVALKTLSGRFLFATYGGLAEVDPSTRQGSSASEVFIKEALIGDAPAFSFLDPFPEKLIVPPGEKRMEFRFTALPCTRPERIRFEYKMENFDREWVQSGVERTAVYTNLPPGSYRFRVRSINDEGRWNVRGGVLDLTLKPYLYQRHWVQLIALLLFTSIFSIGTHVARRYIRAMKFWRKRHYVSHFKLVENIGAGGMGTVYRAKDTVPPYREVALKVLRDSDFANESQKRRFKKESQIIEKLEHPHIVRILEKGDQGDMYYLAMEYLKGGTLFDLLQRQLKFPEAMHIMLQLSDVLAKIHDKNIVHRDLKPQNIMIVPHEEDPLFVKLLDFGVALDFNQTRLTESGIIVGTLRYLPPEAIQNGVTSAAGDIYSLGVIFYEMLTGYKPFSGETMAEIFSQMMKLGAEIPQRLRGEIPPALGALVIQMIDRLPQNRPSSRQVHESLLQIRTEAKLFLPLEYFSR